MRSIILVALVGLLFLATTAHAAPPIPKLEGPVNDYAHVLSSAQQSQLCNYLLEKEAETSNQIVVLTIPSLDGNTIEDYSIKVARAWNLGQKGNKNGVLLTVAINDHKIRIEVNGGLQGVLTDALSSEIIRNEITPSFKAGDYFGGIWAGVHAIDKAIHGQYRGTGRQQRQHAPTIDVGTLLFWMIFFIVILASHVRFRRYRNQWLGPVWIPNPTSGFGSSSSSGGGFFSSGGGGYSGGGGGGGFDGGGASGGW